MCRCGLAMESKRTDWDPSSNVPKVGAPGIYFTLTRGYSQPSTAEPDGLGLGVPDSRERLVSGQGDSPEHHAEGEHVRDPQPSDPRESRRPDAGHHNHGDRKKVEEQPPGACLGIRPERHRDAERHAEPDGHPDDGCTGRPGRQPESFLDRISHMLLDPLDRTLFDPALIGGSLNADRGHKGAGPNGWCNGASRGTRRCRSDHRSSR